MQRTMIATSRPKYTSASCSSSCDRYRSTDRRGTSVPEARSSRTCRRCLTIPLRASKYPFRLASASFCNAWICCSRHWAIRSCEGASLRDSGTVPPPTAPPAEGVPDHNTRELEEYARALIASDLSMLALALVVAFPRARVFDDESPSSLRRDVARGPCISLQARPLGMDVATAPLASASS